MTKFDRDVRVEGIAWDQRTDHIQITHGRANLSDPRRFPDLLGELVLREDGQFALVHAAVDRRQLGVVECPHVVEVLHDCPFSRGCSDDAAIIAEGAEKRLVDHWCPRLST